MEVLGDVGHIEARFGPFVIVLISRHDRHTVCAKCTIGSKITLVVLLGGVDQLEDRFSLFGDSVNLDAR
jgi:hypothetical protein